MNSLPLVIFTGPRAVYKSTGEEECAICLKKFKKDEEVWACIEEPKHIFHIHCIKGWLKQSNTCPLCRGVMTDANELTGGLISFKAYAKIDETIYFIDEDEDSYVLFFEGENPTEKLIMDATHNENVGNIKAVKFDDATITKSAHAAMEVLCSSAHNILDFRVKNCVLEFAFNLYRGIKRLTKLTSLTFSNCGLQPSDAANLSKALPSLRKLKMLDLSNNISLFAKVYSTGELASLLTALRNCKELENLILTQTGIGSYETKALQTYASKAASLTGLDLSNNYFTANDIWDIINYWAGGKRGETPNRTFLVEAKNMFRKEDAKRIDGLVRMIRREFGAQAIYVSY